MRFVFRPPATDGAGLLDLPWHLPLAEWDPRLLLEVPQRGISRHVVRFVAQAGGVFALKEISEPLARHEYALLGEFQDEGLPAVAALGICVDRPHGQDAILVTRYLEYSMSYRYLFSRPTGRHSVVQLLDTLVVLLVRLHLAGVFWGDCSLSNTLFRLDAGTLAAYLVDAETAERHPQLSDGQRSYDIDLAQERVGAELLDLQAGELLPEQIDPIEVANSLPPRYEALWNEVTREEVSGEKNSATGSPSGCNGSTTSASTLERSSSSPCPTARSNYVWRRGLPNPETAADGARRISPGVLIESPHPGAGSG